MKALGAAQASADPALAPTTSPLAPVHNRASGTFTPIYDQDLALALKPTSAMLLWTVLNRFWSMRTPLYTPGQERLMKHTGLSKKTIERALKVLQDDRRCRFRCGREHPLVLVRWNGMGHNATITPFTCDLIKPPKPSPREQPAPASSPREQSLRQKRQNDAPLFQGEASFCPPQIRQNDAPLPEVRRQNDSAVLGTQKPLLETPATETTDVVANLADNTGADVVRQLVALGVTGAKATELVSRFGAPACLDQLAAIDERRRRRRHTDNAPGLLIAALERGWEAPIHRTRQAPPLLQPPPGAVDALRMHLESGRIPDAAWLKDAGISRDLYAAIEHEIRENIDSVHSQQPLGEDRYLLNDPTSITNPAAMIRDIHAERCLTTPASAPTAGSDSADDRLEFPHTTALERADPRSYRTRLERILASDNLPEQIGIPRSLDNPVLLTMCRSKLEKELATELAMRQP